MLVALIGALAALAAGVYLLISPGSNLFGESTTSDPTRRAGSVAQETPPAPEATPPSAAKWAASRQPSTVTYARPVRLIIPKIDLDAAIEDVALTAEGAMASPSGPDKVGWYEPGPRPGNPGSAVIDGHSGYADGTAAAFDRLPELGKGDRLYVEDAMGRPASFIVRDTRLYARDADATEVFASTTDSRLNLITCTGSFDVGAGTHSQRLVVFADLEVPARPARRQ